MLLSFVEDSEPVFWTGLVLLMTVTFNFKGDSPTAAGSVQTKKKPTSFGQAKLLKAE